MIVKIFNHFKKKKNVDTSTFYEKVYYDQSISTFHKEYKNFFLNNPNHNKQNVKKNLKRTLEKTRISKETTFRSFLFRLIGNYLCPNNPNR